MRTLFAQAPSGRTRRQLSELAVGERGRIGTIAASPSLRLRLMELGMTSGTIVEVIREAPMGDPVELQIRGYRLSLRRAEAAAVGIEAEG